MKVVRIAVSLLIVASAGYVLYVTSHYEVPILMYHSLDASRIDTYSVVSPQRFREQMNFIKKGGYRVISLEDYCRMLAKGEKPSRKTVVITFDDGHKDNILAGEILKEFAFPATIFLIANKLGQPGYLSQQEVRQLLDEGYIDIGSHTLNEVYLPDADSDTLQREIVDSRTKLSQFFGEEIDTISYTIGGFNRDVLYEVAQAGYLCACTTNRGYDRTLNRFALRRIKVTNRDGSVRFMAKLSGHYNLFRTLKKPY